MPRKQMLSPNLVICSAAIQYKYKVLIEDTLKCSTQLVRLSTDMYTRYYKYFYKIFVIFIVYLILFSLS